MDLEVMKKLHKPANTKIVYLVMDGLGGLPFEKQQKTELETAKTPHLDSLATQAICGLQEPVGPGITPGSGPGHLSLFGYDPLKYQVGRGVLAALGINFDLQNNDVAARGNFCTIDSEGKVTDRRAGRISTEKNKELCQLLRTINLPNVEIFIETVKEHRFLLVLRGTDLSGNLLDTDPQEIGKKPLPPTTTTQDAQPTADLVSQFLAEAQKVLADQHPANMVLLRGFSQKPQWPTMQEAYGLRCAAIASYPMYRGLARLIGMEVIETCHTVEEEFETVQQQWDNYDFFFVHVKGTDSSGEDGDFQRKVTVIESVDALLPKLIDLHPDVMIVTGDHSTPSALKFHSWHPVPLLIYAKHCREDEVAHFGERACIKGGLGPRFPAKEIMSIACANAQRLEKFGA